jgi:hypothetical protein
MIPAQSHLGARVQRRWHRSATTAHALSPYRRLFPTCRIRDAVFTRRGLKWGVPAMLLAAPYFAISWLCTEAIADRGPGWLHLIVLLCAWNAIKMLLLGPLSLIALARTRLRERRDRREAEAAQPAAPPQQVAAPEQMMVGAQR